MKRLTTVCLLFLIFVIIKDPSTATAQTTNIDLNAWSTNSDSNASISPVPLSPTSGEKIVDQGAVSQYNQDNYLQYD